MLHPISAMPHFARPMLLALAALALAGGCRAFEKPVHEPVMLAQLSEDPTLWQQTKSGTGHLFTWVYDLSTERPGELARMATSAQADERRQAILGLSSREYGLQPPYTDLYVALAAEDPNDLVRIAAIRASVRAQDERVVPTIVRELSSQNVLIRTESVKACALFHPPEAAEPLRAMLKDTEQPLDIRIAAADALAGYADPDTFRDLAGRLRDKQFAVSWQSRQSLQAITGVDHRYGERAWLEWLVQNPDFGK